MNEVVLLELARRWDADAVSPNFFDGSEEAKVSNARAEGERAAKVECADTLRLLVRLLGTHS